MRKMRNVLGSIMAFLALVSAAPGQVVPAGNGIEIDGWRYTPVVQGASGQQTVAGFLGLLTPALVSGSNITAILYIRESDGQWTATAWHNENEWKIVQLVKSQLGIGPVSDEDWFTWGPPDGSGASTQQGSTYQGGFFTDDPIAAAVQGTPLRDEVVAVLQAIGYPVADVSWEKSDNTDACDPNDLLGSLVVGVEAELNTGANGEAAANAALALTCAPFCTEKTWESLPSPWVCGFPSSWVLVGQRAVTIPGGTPHILCDYRSCQTCTQSKNIYHRYRNCGLGWCVQSRAVMKCAWESCDDTDTLVNFPNPDPCRPVPTCMGDPDPGTFDPQHWRSFAEGTPTAWGPPCSW